MLEFLKRNMLGKVVHFNFFNNDEYTIGFLDDIFINKVEQSEYNKNLYIFNKTIGVYIYSYRIDEEYPYILSAYNHSKICTEISFVNDGIDIWS